LLTLVQWLAGRSWFLALSAEVMAVTLARVRSPLAPCLRSGTTAARRPCGPGASGRGGRAARRTDGVGGQEPVRRSRNLVRAAA